MVLSSVCVYCGSHDKVAQKYKTAAQTIGTGLAQRGSRLIYGGGHVGLMGVIADAVLAAGGEVVGIIPEHIRAQEVQHNGLTELHVVADMHTRKRMMVERADAFVVLPGGLGTLDETFEVMTWKKLKLHNKPIILFNQDNFWTPMIALIENTIAEGFSQPPDRALYAVAETPEKLFALLDEPSLPFNGTHPERI